MRFFHGLGCGLLASRTLTLIDRSCFHRFHHNRKPGWFTLDFTAYPIIGTVRYCCILTLFVYRFFQTISKMGSYFCTPPQLQGLLSESYRVQEETQERIAHDMHDGVTQTIIGALYEIQAAQDSLVGSPAVASINL